MAGRVCKSLTGPYILSLGLGRQDVAESWGNHCGEQCHLSTRGRGSWVVICKVKPGLLYQGWWRTWDGFSHISVLRGLKILIKGEKIKHTNRYSLSRNMDTEWQAWKVYEGPGRMYDTRWARPLPVTFSSLYQAYPMATTALLVLWHSQSHHGLSLIFFPFVAH